MKQAKPIQIGHGDDNFPAIALIEFNSIAIGILAGDAMVKKAPLAMVKAGTIHPGKYLVLVGGEVAPVEESYNKGLKVGNEALVDQIFLPDIHPQVLQAVLGKKTPNQFESLGVIETSTVAANIGAADAAVKGAHVIILEIRLADGLGGHGLTLLGGKVEDVQAAVEIGVSRIKSKEIDVHTTVVPRIDDLMSKEIDRASRFFNIADE
jgi:microcompartment protein CcmL/EutN